MSAHSTQKRLLSSRLNVLSLVLLMAFSQGVLSVRSGFWPDLLIQQNLVHSWEFLGSLYSTSIQGPNQLLHTQCMSFQEQLDAVYSVDCALHKVGSDLVCCHACSAVGSFCSSLDGLFCEGVDVITSGKASGCPVDPMTWKEFFSAVNAAARKNSIAMAIRLSHDDESDLKAALAEAIELEPQQHAEGCFEWWWPHKQAGVHCFFELLVSNPSSDLTPDNGWGIATASPQFPVNTYSAVVASGANMTYRPTAVVEQSECSLTILGFPIVDYTFNAWLNASVMREVGWMGSGMAIDYLSYDRASLLNDYYIAWMQTRCCENNHEIPGGLCTKIYTYNHCDPTTGSLDVGHCSPTCVATEGILGWTNTFHMQDALLGTCPPPPEPLPESLREEILEALLTILVALVIAGLVLLAGIVEKRRSGLRVQQYMSNSILDFS